MKSFKLRKAIALMLIVLFGISCPKTFSQVTIGSDEAPPDGAVLQLKNIAGVTNGEANATKGLMLPRVKLIAASGTNMASTINGATGTYDPTLHIGLVVYNINNDACPMVKSGPYIWNGENWKSLIIRGKDPMESETATTLTDRQGNIYSIAKFGVAGTWMTQNLRTTSQPGETNPILESSGFSYTVGYYAYPQTADTYWPGKPSYWQPEYGLLYNWSAATNNDNCYTADQGQSTTPSTGAGEIESITGHVQGICPYGWHIPSDREWNQLEKELTEHASLYSDLPNGVWDPAWETTNSQRGNINGTVMKSKTRVKIAGGADFATPTNGASNAPTANGFSALLTGTASSGKSSDYGYNGSFWTSSVQASILAYYRAVFADQSYVHRSGLPKGWFFSVRCKKN